MKSKRSFVRLGVNQSHIRSYGADLQRRMADEGAISCDWFGGTDCKSVWLQPSSSRMGFFDPSVNAANLGLLPCQYVESVFLQQMNPGFPLGT